MRIYQREPAQVRRREVVVPIKPSIAKESDCAKNQIVPRIRLCQELDCAKNQKNARTSWQAAARTVDFFFPIKWPEFQKEMAPKTWPGDDYSADEFRSRVGLCKLERIIACNRVFKMQQPLNGRGENSAPVEENEVLFQQNLEDCVEELEDL
jgi:hypothetical protein